MSTKRTILVAHDFSPNSGSALDEAIRLARLSGAEVVLLHAFVSLVPYTGDPMATTAMDSAVAERDAEIAILENIVGRIRNLHVEARLRVADRAAATAILEAADAENAELIILGTHARRGLDRALLGSVAETVVRKARRPVLVVKPGRRSPLEPIADFRVVVAVDFSPASIEAIAQAAGLARMMEGRLYLVHVCDLSEPTRDRAAERLDVIAEELRARGIPAATSVAWASDPAKAIVAEVEGDPRAVIAIGTRGSGRLAQLLLGSVARDVVRNAPCPVLIAHSPLDAGLWQAERDAAPRIE